VTAASVPVDSGARPVSRLNPRDLMRVGSIGLRSRRLRASLSALGISIGIAAIVGVLGISQSSKTGLLTELGRLGNLLTVQPGQTFFGKNAQLSPLARGMVSRIHPVTDVSATGSVANVAVYRNQHISSLQTGGISVQAADPHLLATL
jgi:putative ABC transport system permease protein